MTIDFPILEDVSMQMRGGTKCFHPRHAPSAAVRALFVIDPRGQGARHAALSGTSVAQ